MSLEHNMCYDLHCESWFDRQSMCMRGRNTHFLKYLLGTHVLPRSPWLINCESYAAVFSMEDASRTTHVSMLLFKITR